MASVTDIQTELSALLKSRGTQDTSHPDYQRFVTAQQQLAEIDLARQSGFEVTGRTELSDIQNYLTQNNLSLSSFQPKSLQQVSTEASQADFLSQAQQQGLQNTAGYAEAQSRYTPTLANETLPQGEKNDDYRMQNDQAQGINSVVLTTPDGKTVRVQKGSDAYDKYIAMGAKEGGSIQYDAGGAPIRPETQRGAQQQLVSSYTGPSIVDYLDSVGQASDFGTRSTLAGQYGIQNYTGTAAQNTQLLNTLRTQNPQQPIQNAPAPTGQVAPPQGNYTSANVPQPVDIQDVFNQFGVDFDIQGFMSNPVASFEDTYDRLYKNLGISELKSEASKLLKQATDIDNELADKVSDVNDDPWLTEGVRIDRIRKLQDRYDLKKAAVTNTLALYDKTIDSLTDQARFLVKGAYDQYNADRNFTTDMIGFIYDRVDKANQAMVDQREFDAGLTQQNFENRLAEARLALQEKQFSADEAYRYSDTGGGGKVSDAQRTLAGYAVRIEQANPTFDSLGSTIASMNPISFYTQMIAPPTFQSQDIQSYTQSSRNFINAVLRRESGAVISEEEFANARQQYLPQPGDTAQTLQQKALNRSLVYESLKQASGGAYSSQEDLLGGTYNPTDIESLRTQYGY